LRESRNAIDILKGLKDLNWTVDQLKEMLKQNPALKVNKQDLPKLQEVKKHKYNAQPGWIDGIYFDSQAEMERYGELQIMKLAGLIKSFEVHPKYELSAGITYKPDFRIVYPDGSVVVEEVKGKWTADARMRVKLFREKYPGILLKIIKNGEVVPE